MSINQNGKVELSKLSLDEQVSITLAAYPNVDKDTVKEIISSIDPDHLTFESLDLAISELISNGELGSKVVLLTRENSDLRASIAQSRKLNILLAIGIFFATVVLMALLFLFAGYPKYKTIQTIDNSVICELDPKSNPALTDGKIMDFARTAVLSAYTFDYINYRTQLDVATTRYFTSEGRAALNRALRNSGSLAHIINNNLIMKTVVTSAAQIEEKNIDNTGKLYWVVRMPVTTEFYTGDSKPADVQRFIAQVKIVSTTRDALNTSGLGVNSLTLRPPKE